MSGCLAFGQCQTMTGTNNELLVSALNYKDLEKSEMEIQYLPLHVLCYFVVKNCVRLELQCAFNTEWGCLKLSVLLDVKL